MCGEVAQMTKDKWIWMPHAGHLMIGSDCKFHLNTCVGGYIVSTVGEWWPDAAVRRIHAEVHDSVWYAENSSARGDNFDHLYMKRFGYMEIGIFRTYETMVFRAMKDKVNLCCPWKMISGENLDMRGYKDAGEAYKGHLKMCRIWAAKDKKKIKK